MTPVLAQWDGDAFVPLARHRLLCDKQFVVGDVYPLVPVEERSRATHNHFFACLHDAWLNLPEDVAERFPTEEHLRKYALIKAGYYDETTLVCASKDEALRVAAFVRGADDFAIVTTNGKVVTRFTAKSQSMRAMGKKAFAESKQKVLDIVSEMIGAKSDDLGRAA